MCYSDCMTTGDVRSFWSKGRIHTDCAFDQSRSYPDWSQPTFSGGFDSYWSGSHSCMWELNKVWHAHVCWLHVYQQWVHFSGIHTVFHVLAHLEKSSDKDAMVAVWRCGHLKSMCAHELVPHNAVWMQLMHIGKRIEFTLYYSVTELVWIQIQCRQTLTYETCLFGELQ